MKQKEAVKLTLEELDRQAEKDREEMEDRQDNARPFLIKRIGVGLLDFVFMLVIVAASFFFADFVFFDAVGYNDASDYIITTYTESGLFISENGSFKQLPERYDEEQDLILYYDVPITNFYKTNQKAISENKLVSYNQAKLDSNYFIVNELNEIVRKEGVSNVNLQNFLENKYTEAYNLFIDNNDLNLATQKMFNTITFTILISTTIGAGIIYIVIPLLDSSSASFIISSIGLLTYGPLINGIAQYVQLLLQPSAIFKYAKFSPVEISLFI